MNLRNTLTRSLFLLIRDNALTQKQVALMVKFPALEAARGGARKGLASSSQMHTFHGDDSFHAEHWSNSALLKEAGFGETAKEAVSAGQKAWV